MRAFRVFRAPSATYRVKNTSCSTTEGTKHQITLYSKKQLSGVRRYAHVNRTRFITREMLEKKEQEQVDAEFAERKEGAKLRRIEKKKEVPIDYQQAGPEATSDLNNTIAIPKYTPPETKALNIGVMGIPNAGKSTLINRLVGEKVSIVTPKSQTTRERTLGVLTTDKTQLVFNDTPGVYSQRSAKKLPAVNRDIIWDGWDVIEDTHIELVLSVVDVVKTIDDEIKFVMKKLHEGKQQNIKEVADGGPKVEYLLALNKADQLKTVRTPLASIRDRFRLHIPYIDEIFDKVFYISALNGDGVPALKNALLDRAIPQEWMYPKEYKTGYSQLKRAAEVIREKIYKHINLEVPYYVKQRNIAWTNIDADHLLITQDLLVPKSSQVGILVGRGKRVLDSIQDEAQRELAVIFKKSVTLQLWVKVNKNAYLDPTLF